MLHSARDLQSLGVLGAEAVEPLLRLADGTASGLGAAERLSLPLSISGVLVRDLLDLVSLPEAEDAGEDRPDPLPAARK